MKYKDILTENDIKELLQVLMVHHKLVNKVPEKDLGFMNKKLFIKHKNHINTLKEELDKK